jgi:SagB-type dehydrogenase family enzyme
MRHAGRLSSMIVFIFASTCHAGTVLQLPAPADSSKMTVNEAIDMRRSHREFTDGTVSLPHLSGILHAASGITSDAGFRAAPSAGATYPMTVYVVAENVDELEPGIYEFDPVSASLQLQKPGEYLSELAEAAWGQSFISEAPLAIVMSAEFRITTRVYGDRGVTYVHMEAGHMSQNVYLYATSMGMGTVAVGAFDDESVSTLLDLPEEEIPLYVMPVGWI